MTRRLAALTAGAALFAALLGMIPGSAPAQTFGVFRELWTGLSSSDTSMGLLTNSSLNPNWPNNPNATYTKVFTNFETEVNLLDGYGQRLRAFLVPPTNGTYTFWIASDDASSLFLSSDESPVNKTLIASVSSWTNPREWTKEANQQSLPITLDGGRRYYVEVVHREGSGGDNLAVRWQVPDTTFEEPLTATTAAGPRLIPFRGTTNIPGIYIQPANITVIEGRDAVFSLLVTNQGGVSYQWQADSNSIPGAQRSVHTVTAPTLPANNGQRYRCVVTNAAGAVTSSEALLTVLADTNAPTLAGAINLSSTNVLVGFSEPVEEASATNLTHYAMSGGIMLSSAVLNDPQTVLLTTSPLLLGSIYTVTVSNVRDRATAPNVIAPNSQATFTAIDFVPLDLGGPTPAGSSTAVAGGYNLTGGGGDIGGATDQFQFSYQSRSGNFDVQVRVGALVSSEAWAKAGLMARESLAANSRFTAVFATPTLGGCFFESRATTGSAAALAGSFPVNYPWTWLRLQRVGTVFTGLASLDGVNWQQLGSANVSLPGTVYFGMAVTSHNPAQTATAQFRELGPSTGGAIGPVVLPTESLAACSRRTGLVLSEIMYHPKARPDSNNLEFVEVFNSQAFYEDLSGYRLSGDISYTFPAGTVLAAGAFLVVAQAPADVQTVYGLANVLGPYTNSLPNDKGTVRLRNRQDAVLLEVNYDSRPPWPVAADGAGHSLVLARPSQGEGNAAAWAQSDVIGGSPGRGESVGPEPMRSLRINEFLADTDGPLLDYVELFNAGSLPVDLNGAFLSDKASTNKFRITNSLVLPARGFAVFDQNQLGFSLDGGGEDIFLVNSNQTRVLDAVRFEGQVTGVASGRFPDGAPGLHELAARSPGTTNSPLLIRDIVINEIMYAPVSGDSNDEYVELYNRGAGAVSLAAWQFTDGIAFTFPSNAVIAAGGYLVVARNLTNLLAHYPNLTASNTVGNFSGSLAHRGERLALSLPLSSGFAVMDEVTFGTGGRWGQWADGGGSSLELIDPRSDHRLAANWADSDESGKTTNWTAVEITGTLDNGNASNPADSLQFILLGAGECLVDNVEARPGTNGANAVANSTFESGVTGWFFQGTHDSSGWETNAGFASARSLHIRASSDGDTGANRTRTALSPALASGSIATLRAKVRWLKGSTECLLRVRGNWLEAAAVLQTPPNPGTPGARNSRYITNAGPAISAVTHSPALPAADQSVVVTARLHDPDGVGPVALNYRLDPSPAYNIVAMRDDGTGGDALAGDGIYSGTIPGQPAGTLVAFYLQATDGFAPAAATTFPNDAPAREGLVRFGEALPSGSFGTYRLWMTQATLNRWIAREKRSNEPLDCTFVNGNSRVIYNMGAFYSGSAFHSPSYDSPIGAFCNYSLHFPADDELLGTDDFRILFPGNSNDDETYQREQTAYWLARELGLPYNSHRYVNFFINGVKRGNIIEDAQVPGGQTVNQFFPDDADGDLMKIAFWYEYVDDLSGNTGIATTLGNFTTTGGAKKTARYRWNFEKHATAGSKHNYTNIFQLVDVVNSIANYTATVDSAVDTEQWMRILASEHIVGNWDSYGYRNGQNMYLYKPEHDKWKLIIWDIDIAWGIGGYGDPATQNIFENTTDPLITTMYNTPQFRRAYLRLLQEAVDGPLRNSAADPVLDAKFAGFQANGVGATAPTVIKTYLLDRRNYLIGQLAAVAATFSVNGATNFSTNVNLVTLTGTAPVGLQGFTLNGVPYPVTWNTVTNWTMLVALLPGANSLLVQGYDRLGHALTNMTRTFAISYTGPSLPPQGTVVINEIMYRPLVPQASFVELFNTSTNVAFDLSGWRVNGLDYTFPSGTILTNRGFLVLARNRAAFAAAYGSSNAVFAVFDGNLQTNGETLTLIRPGLNPAQDVVIDKVRYENSAPWITTANGGGYSLQLVDAQQDNSRVSNWGDGQGWRFASATGTLQGNSSGTNLLLFLDSAADLYLDDIRLVPGTVAGVGPSILQNGDFESPLSGPWVVSPVYSNSVISSTVAHSGNNSLHILSAGPGGAQATSIYQKLVDAVTNTTYTLSYWYLSSTIGTNLTARTFPGALNIQSRVNIRPIFTSPGAANANPTALPPYPPLWINELQPNNLTCIVDNNGQNDPWLELYNSGTNDLSLDGFYLANNFTNLTQWSFPPGSSLAAGEFRIVWADAEPFQTTPVEWHANFRLNSATGAVAVARIVATAPQIVDYIKYANIGADLSYGSFPDGQSFDRQIFYIITPGYTNYSPLVNVFINEWMASNTGFMGNPANNNKFDDWFELFNAGGAPADLSGYYLSDTAADLTHWRIPDGTVVAPGAYLFAWADNAAGTVNTPDLHANFQLSKGGEGIVLTAPDQVTVIDSVLFGAQANNISQGRYPDGAAGIHFMSAPTPRAPNVFNTPPTLNLITNRTVFIGQNVTFTATAADVDLPPQTLVFSLDPVPPPTAFIDSANGQFSWSPNVAQAPSTNYNLTVRVTDNGNPPQSAARTFIVTVLPLPRLTSLTHTPGGDVSLTFDSVPDRTYRVEYKNNLTNLVWTPLPGGDIPATGPTLMINDPAPDPTQRFYRLRVVSP